jgi:hypothetical protein
MSLSPYKFVWSITRPGEDQPEQQVESQSGDAARDQRDQKGQPEPKGADPKELGQAAANAGNDAVVPGTAQGFVLGGCIHKIFSVLCVTHTYG